MLVRSGAYGAGDGEGEGGGGVDGGGGRGDGEGGGHAGEASLINPETLLAAMAMTSAASVDAPPTCTRGLVGGDGGGLPNIDRTAPASDTVSFLWSNTMPVASDAANAVASASAAAKNTAIHTAAPPAINTMIVATITTMAQ